MVTKRTGTLWLLLFLILGAAWMLEGRGPSREAHEGRAPEGTPSPVTDPDLAARLEGVTTPRAPSSEAPTPDAPTPSTGTLRGRVVDQDGHAISDLTIRLVTGRRYASCDIDGRFTFSGVPAGHHRLEALAETQDAIGEGAEVSLAEGQVLDDVLLRVPRPLELGGGVVDDAGDPVGGLSFHLRSATGGWGFFRRPIRTAPDGRFKAKVWTEDTYEALATDGPLEGRVEAGQLDARLVYAPSHQRFLTIRVLGPRGEVVPNATVVVLTGTNRSSLSGPTYGVRDGVLRLPASDLSSYVERRVQGPKDASGEPLPLASTVVRDLDKNAGEVVVRLEEARTVRGQVLAADETPVAHARVWLKPADGTPSVGAWFREADADGRFHFEGCPPGPFRLQVGRAKGVDCLGGEAVLVPPETSEVVLHVRRGAALEVVVLTPDGEPAVGVTVDAWPRGDPICQSRGKTDATGRVRLSPLPPGRTLDVQIGNWRSDVPYPSRRFQGAATAPGEVELVLPKAVEVRGVVVTEDGRPRGDVPVIGQDARDLGPIDYTRSEPVTGAFVLRRMRRGRARVWLGHGRDGRPSTGPVEVDAPSTGIRLVVPRSIPVEGRLLVADPQAWTVEWALPNGNAVATIEEDGHFLVAHARGKVGALLARPRIDPWKSKTHDEETPVLVALLEGVHPGDGPFLLVPEPGGIISGTVQHWDDDARDPWNTHVRLRRGDVTLSGNTDTEGRFEVKGVPPGTWNVELWGQRTLDRVRGVEAGRTHVTLTYPEDGAAPR